MAITRISIENFKGIGRRVEIPIRPITLLFGANSAGKSTILQALLYMRELLSGASPDVHQISKGGSHIDLGGFANLVHRHDLRNEVVIEVSMTLDGDGLANTGLYHLNIIGEEEPVRGRGAQFATEISIELTVGVGVGDTPYIKSFRLLADSGMDSDPGDDSARPKGELHELDQLALCVATPKEAGQLTQFNPAHPAITGAGLFDDPGIPADEYAAAAEIEAFLDAADSLTAGGLTVGTSALPNHDWLRESDQGDELFQNVLFKESEDRQTAEAERKAVEIGYEIVTNVLGLSVKRMLAELDRIRYIGPLRKPPPRGLANYPGRQEEDWFDGTAAWATLYDPDNFDQRTADLIEDLGLGFRIEPKPFWEVPELSRLGSLLEQSLPNDPEALERLMPQIVSAFGNQGELRKRTKVQLEDIETGLPVEIADVGAGVGQVIPVVVGAAHPGCSLLAVEQPELHLHPAIQCNLGDLFIKAAHQHTGRRFLLETHSEHLLLRLLRRIRETNASGTESPDEELGRESLSVIFASKSENGTILETVAFTERGKLASDWPGGFFEERLDELF